MSTKNNTITITNIRRVLVPSLWERVRVRLLFLLLILCGTLSAQHFQGTLHIEQREFRQHNDSLCVGFDIQIDSHAVPSCAMMIFEPELRDSSEHVVTLPYIQVNGEQRARLNRRWFHLCSDKWLDEYLPACKLVNLNKYTGETLSFNFRLPYEEWMDEARLVLKQEVTGCAGEQQLYTYTLSGSVITEFREPYTVQPLVALVTPADEVKTRNRQGSAFLDFQAGRSVILPDFRRNPVELGKINDALADVMADIDSEITGLFIEGYASPEGKYTTNDRLAHERAVALKEYIRNRYILPENIFTVKSVAEDWEGLKALVERGDLPQKEQVLTIIGSYDEPDVKERKLKSLSVYNRLLRDFFPELRRVEYQIDYSVRNYTNAEARNLINSHPENLSQAELFRVALEYGKESSQYRNIIMEIIPEYYGNDPIALSNAAALLIENGEINTALRLLEKAGSIPAAWNNSGVVYLLQGNLEQAEQLLNQAHVAGIQEAVHNLEELKKKREDDNKRKRK